eukprot:TRINITY_DN3298_c0_g2_i1.p1 TRINITY_DN3298_c0_g2~~TRINITY_DN3298_c0_g2_i1.p1  ORF type:complete len:585 (+),score=158.98 TRINITY_DN3298_c0_g2_i1:86-1756(+)
MNTHTALPLKHLSQPERILQGDKTIIWGLLCRLQVAYAQIVDLDSDQVHTGSTKINVTDPSFTTLKHTATMTLPKYTPKQWNLLEASILSWLCSIGVVPQAIVPNSLLELQEDISSGILLANVVKVVTGEFPTGIITSPKTDSVKIANISKCCEALRRCKDMSRQFTWAAESILVGERKITLGLLQDIHRFYDGDDTKLNGIPYFGAHCPVQPLEDAAYSHNPGDFVPQGEATMPASTNTLTIKPHAPVHSKFTDSMVLNVKPGEGYQVDMQDMLNRKATKMNVDYKHHHHEEGNGDIDWSSAYRGNFDEKDKSARNNAPLGTSHVPLKHRDNDIYPNGAAATKNGTMRLSAFDHTRPNNSHTSQLGSETQGNIPDIISTRSRLNREQALMSSRLGYSGVGSGLASRIAPPLVAPSQMNSFTQQSGRVVAKTRAEAEYNAHVTKCKSIIAWMRQNGVRIRKEQAFISGNMEEFQNGTNLGQLLISLNGLRVDGIRGLNLHPKNSAQAMNNIRECMKLLRKKKTMPLELLSMEKRIVSGDCEVILKLLMQMRKAYRK